MWGLVALEGREEMEGIVVMGVEAGPDMVEGAVEVRILKELAEMVKFMI